MFRYLAKTESSQENQLILDMIWIDLDIEMRFGRGAIIEKFHASENIKLGWRSCLVKSDLGHINARL